MPKLTALPRDSNKDYLLAAVENSGKLEGNYPKDYAQLTGVVLKDLQQIKGLFKGKTMAEVRSNPSLYNSVVDAYWKRMEDFGIINPVAKAVFWRSPAHYKQTGGDVTKIADPYLRNVYENRLKNLQTFAGASPLSIAIAGANGGQSK